MSMIFEDETAETEAERTRDFSGFLPKIRRRNPNARLKSKSASRQRGCGSILI